MGRELDNFTISFLIIKIKFLLKSKGTIHEKVMEQLEPSLDNDIAKKLAEKAVEKAIDKSWDKIKQRFVLKFSKEE